MSSYLKNVSSAVRKTKSEDYEQPEDTSVDEQETPKKRRPRGTSEFVQVKVRRTLFEPLAVVAKMNSMSSAEVIEKILEVHVGQFQDTLKTLKLDNMF